MSQFTRLARSIQKFLLLLGFDPRQFFYSLRGLPLYCRDYRQFRQQLKDTASPFAFGQFYPCLADRFSQSGVASGHYFHQDLLVASKIHARRPEKHVDIGSRIDGFVAHVASFREIEVLDIRALHVQVPNIRFLQADLMSDNFNLTGYCDSVSSLHAVEHFGLGRYGDPVDCQGHLKGLNNIYRLLRPGGRFYLSVPIGPPRLEFNAHRVFGVEYLLALFKDRYRVASFAYVDDRGDLHREVPLTPREVAGNFSCRYGCGVFELVKL